MRSGAISYSSALSKGVKVSDDHDLDGLLKQALYFQDVMYAWMTIKACSDFRAMMAMMPKWKPAKCLKEFHATDRTSVLNCVQVEYEKHDEVLEMVLANNFSVGPRLSKKYTAIVECPDQEELMCLPPPPSKGTGEQLCDSVQDMVRTVTLQPRLEEPATSRWVRVDSQIIEIHLSKDGPIRSHRISKHVSVFSRRASVDEVRPYNVELHISQKAWYEKMSLWMTQRAETAAIHTNRYVTNPGACGPPGLDGAIVLSSSIDSLNSFDSLGKKKHFPMEIEVVNGADKTKPVYNVFKSAPSIDGIWVPDYDVVVGVSKDKQATTFATEIMKTRIVPFFGSKTGLRPSQVHVMTLMLQEELKDDEKFAERDLPMANFWMKLADCDEEARKKENVETKWLRKENGDFMGPFVHASIVTIHKAAEEWVEEFALAQSEAAVEEAPRDPEPSITGSQTSIRPIFDDVREEAKEEHQPVVESEEKASDVLVAAMPSYECPALFNLTGPIESLDQKAKVLCQEWVNDSETLLIKAAKKTLIDAFQADFHSFLFLFQLQLKRIKGGYEGHSVSSGQADDTSWVSAEPSVQEEDSRVADIEAACVAFMNRMGNDMVNHYEKLSGDKASSVSSVVDGEVREEVRDGASRSTLDKYIYRKTGPIGGSIHSKQKVGRQQQCSDPALVHKDEVPQLGEVSIDLSTASTVQRFGRQAGVRVVPRAKNRNALPPSGRAVVVPRKRREEDHYDSDEGSSMRSDPTYGESLEGSLDTRSYDQTDEEEEDEGRSYESRGRTRRGRRSDGRREYRDVRSYDYDSPCSNDDDDTYPTVLSEPLESLTLSPSDLSMDDRPKKTPTSTGWGSSWVVPWM